MKARLLMFIGIALSSSIIYFALNSTNDHREYELIPIELTVAEKLQGGAVWHFSGSVYDFHTQIDVSVKDPLGNIITTDTIMPDEDGIFDFKITTGGPLWKNAGKYILILEQGEFKEIQTFKILENEISIPIGLENEI